MKISQEVGSQKLDGKQIRTKSGSNKSFNNLVQSQTYKLKQQEIHHLMKRIAAQGEQLSQFYSIGNLVKFKRLVKGFLEETVYSGLHLYESHQLSLEGNNRKLAIVKEVDEKLIELTEEVMNHEEKSVNLLGIIGEIKGLLINIYT